MMQKRKILVVEDNPLNRKLVVGILNLFAITVIEASDAEKGIELARRERPDLILMDIQLPGMDGLTATGKIKKDPEIGHIPVIALTAHAMQEDYQKARDAGCMAYLSKPIDREKFLQVIERLFFKDKLPANKATVFPNKARILVVDDEPLNVKLLAASLPADRFEIVTAFRGEDALALVREKNPDLVLLDVMMPGMDGFQVTSRLKSDPRTQEIPIILVTALDGKEDKKRGLDIGADEFLNKPVNASELQARILSLLRLKTYQEQLSSRKTSQDRVVGDQKITSSQESGDNVPAVLLVEDSRADSLLLQNYLADLPCRVHMANKCSQMLSIVQHEKIDLILLDILLPDGNGFELCRKLKENSETYPIQVIMVTTLDDLESKVKGFELGVDEFLVKPVNREELRARVRAAFRKKAFFDFLTQKADTALEAAVTDRLTGLYNRAYLGQFLEMEIKRSLQKNHPLSLLMIDVDDFKVVNDTYGHLEGDRVLVDISRLIRSSVRDIDLTSRYGGDEFVVVLPYTSKDSAHQLVQRLLCNVKEYDFFSDISHSQKLPVSISIGIASLKEDGVNMEVLIRQADAALYQAKDGGKNRVCSRSQIA